MISDAAMINRLEKEIKKLQEKLRDAHNKDALESLQQKILYRELQILHPKVCLTSTNRRRTWAASTCANKLIALDNFVVPDVPAVNSLLGVPSTSSVSNFINFSRGTKSNSPTLEIFENSFLSESEMFIPGEQAFLSSNRISPSIQQIINENDLHTPVSFKCKNNLQTPEIIRPGRRLGDISRCENCTYIEQELQELREFTKLEYKLDNGEVGWELLVKKESQKIIEQLNEYKNNFEVTQAK